MWGVPKNFDVLMIIHSKICLLTGWTSSLTTDSNLQCHLSSPHQTEQHQTSKNPFFRGELIFCAGLTLTATATDKWSYLLQQ